MSEDAWRNAPRLVLDRHAPRLEERAGQEISDDSLPGMLRLLSSTILRHPVAAQAFAAALIAEGRRFAQTPEGARWKAELRGSELVRGGQTIWEGSALSFLGDDPSVVLPSRIVEAVVQAASQADLHELLMFAADGKSRAAIADQQSRERSRLD